MNNATQTTFYYERLRALSGGVLETAGATFLLLIAVRGFHADATAKALVAAGGSAGLLLTPLVVSRVAAGGWRPAHAAAFLAAVAAISFLIAALAPILPVFIICSILSMSMASAVVPLLTQMYQENYPDAERGRLFGNTVMIRVGMGVVFSDLGGRLLSGHVEERFPWLLLIFGAAFGFSGFCLSRCPSQPLTAVGGTHPFRALRFVKEDRLFRWTLASWMLMGFGNLMMLPLRVEYLANARYGLAFDAITIAFLTGVAPNLARLVMSPLWGWLFDRMNFFVLRMVVNIGFALGILTFFTGDTFAGLLLGAVVFGISNAGGDVAWSLWVTKLAPPDRVADYMAVHTFLTGVRGVIAPMIAFHLLAAFSVSTIGCLSAGMIAAASFMLFPEIQFGRKMRRGTALVEEISE